MNKLIYLRNNYEEINIIFSLEGSDRKCRFEFCSLVRERYQIRIYSKSDDGNDRGGVVGVIGKGTNFVQNSGRFLGRSNILVEF